MQEVGKQWQALTPEQRKYFKDKADRDKVRYLDEQRAFYDEVERIGQEVGTVTTKEGQIIVANTQHNPTDPKGGKGPKLQRGGSMMPNPEITQESSNFQLLLEKRKSAPDTSGLEEPGKRMKLEDRKDSQIFSSSFHLKTATLPGGQTGLQSQHSLALASQNSGIVDNKPKKPLSGYIYFSQEFREIIRQRFPFLNSRQIMKAVSFKWQRLSKEQKHPFESTANEDKQRYDRESVDFKKGSFQGRSMTPLIKLPTESEFVSQALELSDDLLQFLQIKNQEEGAMGKANEGAHENDDDLDELQAQEDALQTEYEKQLREKERLGYQNQISSNLQNLSGIMGQGIPKLLGDGFDEASRQRLDSFMQPQKLMNHKLETDDHVIPDISGL